MPCIRLSVNHSIKPSLVYFCDFLAFPLQVCLRAFSGAALYERLCVKVSVKVSVCKSICV